MKTRLVGFQKQFVLSVSIASLAFGAMQSNAQTIWDGGGTDALWSDAVNWNNDIAPTFPQAVTFDGTANLNTVNDNTGITVNGITFASTAQAFFLGGNGITLGGNIVNSSANLQTINLNQTLVTGTSPTLDGGTAGLTISGGLTGGAAAASVQQVALAGNGDLAGIISSGAGGSTAGLRLNVTNGGNWTIGGNSSSAFGGQLYVSQGTLNFGSGTESPVVTVTNWATTTVGVGSIGAFMTIGGSTSGTATLNMNSGHLILNPTDPLATGAGTSFEMAFGNASVVGASSETANYNQTGGTVSLSGFDLGNTPGVYIGNQNGVTSTFNVSGGLFDAGDSPFLVAVRGTGTVNISGTGVINETGSGLTGTGGTGTGVMGITIADDRQLANTLSPTTTSGTLNLLAGGLLEATSIRMTANRGNTNASATMNFNGGTWQFNGDGANLYATGTNGGTFLTGAQYAAIASTVNNDILKVNVQAGGAKIDKNGHTGAINMPLLHDSALGGTPDGGLDIIGLGTLTLSGGINTYTGGTKAEAGTLIIASGSDLANSVSLTLSPNSTVTLGSGTSLNANLDLFLVGADTLNLSSSSDTIKDLIVNGTYEAPGTYDAAALLVADPVSTFTGTGSLIVTVPEPATLSLVGLGALLLAGARRNKTAK